uniref:hypothetical protein n=1 Tax=Agaricus bitorquis TaxID=5343 RepID=UPI002798DD10|nr:hypothetical protein QLP03_mgp004 [Agaricus bitorquis]WFG53994.1 hypothetical protein [Agaricus bitorquis]
METIIITIRETIITENNNGKDTNNGNNNGRKTIMVIPLIMNPPKNNNMFNPKQILFKEIIFIIVQFLKKIKNAIIFKYFNSSTGAIKHSLLFGFILNKLEIIENGQIITGNNSQSDFYLGIFIITLICLLNVINLLGYIISNYLISKYEIETKFPKLKRLIKYFGKSSLFFILLEGIMCILFLMFMMIVSYILMNR